MDEAQNSVHQTFGFYESRSQHKPLTRTHTWTPRLAGVDPCCLRAGVGTQLQIALLLHRLHDESEPAILSVKVVVEDVTVAQKQCELSSSEKHLTVRLVVPSLVRGQAHLLVTGPQCSGRVHAAFPLLILPANACQEMQRVEHSMLQRCRQQGLDGDWARCRVWEKHFIPFAEDFATIQLLCGPPNAVGSAARLPSAKVLEMSCRLFSFLKGNAMWECLVSLLLLSDKHKDSRLHGRLQEVGLTFSRLLEKVSDGSFQQTVMAVGDAAKLDQPASPPAGCACHEPVDVDSNAQSLMAASCSDGRQLQNQNEVYAAKQLSHTALLSACKASFQGKFQCNSMEQQYAKQFAGRFFTVMDTVMVCLYLLSAMVLLLGGSIQPPQLLAAAVQVVLCLIRMLLHIVLRGHSVVVRSLGVGFMMAAVTITGHGPSLVPRLLAPLVPLNWIIIPFQMLPVHQVGYALFAGLLGRPWAPTLPAIGCSVLQQAAAVLLALLLDLGLRLCYINFEWKLR